MNPLPNRPLITNPNPPMGPNPSVMNPGSAGGVGMGVGVNSNAPGLSGSVAVTAAQNPGLAQPGQAQVPQSFEPIYNGRPRKQLPDGQPQGVSGLNSVSGKEFPLMGGTQTTSATMNLAPASAPPSTGSMQRGNPFATGSALCQQPQQQQQPRQVPQTPDSESGQSQQSQQSPQSQRVSQLPPPLQQDGTQTPELHAEEESSKRQTAIFRPGTEDASEWREKLRATYEQHMQRWRDAEEDESEEVGEEEDESESVGVGVDEGEGDGSKSWKSKRTLRKSVYSTGYVVPQELMMC